jgi:hypothetical protein
MEKIKIADLNLSKEIETVSVFYGAQEIKVKKYASIQTKLEMIANTINASVNDDNNDFYNPVKVRTFLDLEMVEGYTNIEFTEEERENPSNLYDLLKNSGLLDAILAAIPEEVSQMRKDTIKCIRAIYEYEHSVMGIIEKFNTEYSGLDTNASEIHEKLADPNNMALLKEILTKLG